MAEQPPRTVRPGHPVVEALASGRFVDRMVEILGPGDWLVPTEHGFWWTPHRVRHDVEVVQSTPPGGSPFQVCRSTFTVVVDVTNEPMAVTMANYLNQASVGGACWYDFEAKSLKVTSMVVLDPSLWFTAFVFEMTVQRMVGVMERLASWLALECGGAIPDPLHPVHGRRATPDQLVTEGHLASFVPEAAMGSWWSRHEVEAFKRATRFMVESQLNPDWAAQVDPRRWSDDLSAAENVTTEYRFESHGMWGRLAMQEGRHPDFGFGTEFHIVMSEVFGPAPDEVRGPWTSWAGLHVMNSLNELATKAGDCKFLLGGWNQANGQLTHTTFLYPEVVASLQNVATPSVGEVFGVMFGFMFAPMHHYWYMGRELAFMGAAHESTDEVRWRGVSQNAPLFPLLDGHEELWERLARELPLNQLVPPFTLDDERVTPQTQITVADFGVFNPLGPTVGSIEVAVNYQMQRALLLVRERHPSGPTTHVFGMIDFDGFQRLAEFMRPLVASIQWGGPDWFHVRDPEPATFDACCNGLLDFAAATPAMDWAEEARSLFASVNDPWLRLEPDFEPNVNLPADTSGEMSWVLAVTNQRIIDSHVAMLRSAWEGARSFARTEDGAEADRIARYLRGRIAARRGRSDVTPDT